MAAIATIAAEIGEAHMPICEATAAMDSGREGLTFCSFATSAMTGRVANATCPVPHNTVMKNVTVGARKVILFGLCRNIRSLSITSSSRPPATSIAATQEITETMTPMTVSYTHLTLPTKA